MYGTPIFLVQSVNLSEDIFYSGCLFIFFVRTKKTNQKKGAVCCSEAKISTFFLSEKKLAALRQLFPFYGKRQKFLHASTQRPELLRKLTWLRSLMYMFSFTGSFHFCGCLFIFFVRTKKTNQKKGAVCCSEAKIPPFFLSEKKLAALKQLFPLHGKRQKFLHASTQRPDLLRKLTWLRSLMGMFH